MTTVVTEVAPDVYRISTYVEDFDLQFNQFLVKDDDPLLYHTGMKGIFPTVREAVAKVIDPARVRWIGFSHFEADECGALNEWLALAPSAQAVCTPLGAMLSVSDFAVREPKPLGPEDVLRTGKYRFRLPATPHLPHGWDAGHLFEETHRTLLCSDLFHQIGNVEASTESDVVGRFRSTLTRYQAGPLANYMPYHKNTGRFLETLAALKPKTLCPMHGSTFVGDGARALQDLGSVMEEVLGG